MHLVAPTARIEVAEARSGMAVGVALNQLKHNALNHCVMVTLSLFQKWSGVAMQARIVGHVAH